MNNDLYIANPKLSNRVFQYRMLPLVQVYSLPIGAGQQQIIRRADMEETTLNGIIKAAEPYGMVDADDVHTYDKSKRISYLYRVGLPVKEEEIRAAMKHNDNVAVVTSIDRLKNAAATVSQALTAATDGALESVELKVTEVARPDGKTSMGQQVLTAKNPSEKSMRPRSKRSR